MYTIFLREWTAFTYKQTKKFDWNFKEKKHSPKFFSDSF